MGKTEFKFTWPDKSKLSQGAFGIVRKLRKAGFETYIAGGAVRDGLLKRPIQEIDIATSATPAQVKELFAKTIPTGEKHGTVTVFQPLPVRPLADHPPLARGGKERGKYEVTTFRVEGPYKDYRHPSKVKFIKSAEADAKRRDFTINALFYDPDTKQVIDYVDGIADLSHQKIRFIGKSENRIREDALRLLRAVRFAAVLDFGLARDTQKAIEKYAKLIKKISAERIKAELDKILLSKNASIGIGMLDVVGLLQYLLPELKNCQGITQPRNEHAEGDVYAHTLLAIEKFDDSYDLPTRYATFFHDFGKAVTREVKARKITFYGHPAEGAAIAEKICKRLKFSRADTEKITWLVKSHLVPNDFAAMRLGTRRKWGLNPHFPDLLRLFLADVRSALHPSGKGDENPRGYREGFKILKEIAAKPQLKKSLLSGHDVMRILKMKEGPLVGKFLEQLEEKKLNNEIKTKSDAIKFLKKSRF